LEIVMRKTLSRLAVLMIAASAGAPRAQPTPPGAPPPTPPQQAHTPLARTLQDHDWTMQSAADAAGSPLAPLLVPGHPFVMRFDGARLGVKGGCNLMSGGWRLSAQGQLRVARMAATQKACEPPLMAADAAMAALLAQPLQARVEPGETPTLRLQSPEGKRLAFTGRRTAKSLYGAPTRIFLDVAAQRVACTPPLQPPTTCLEVRELRFDDKGLPVGEPGQWQPFYAEIGGARPGGPVQGRRPEEVAGTRRALRRIRPASTRRPRLVTYGTVESR